MPLSKLASAHRAVKVARRFAWVSCAVINFFMLKYLLTWMTIRAPIEPQENNIFDENCKFYPFAVKYLFLGLYRKTIPKIRMQN